MKIKDDLKYQSKSDFVQQRAFAVQQKERFQSDLIEKASSLLLDTLRKKYGSSVAFINTSHELTSDKLSFNGFVKVAVQIPIKSEMKDVIYSVSIKNNEVTLPHESIIEQRVFETGIKKQAMDPVFCDPSDVTEEMMEEDMEKSVLLMSPDELTARIVEAQLQSKGESVYDEFIEKFNKMIKDVRKNPDEYRKELLKLTPRHAMLDKMEFFERLSKEKKKKYASLNEVFDRQTEIASPEEMSELPIDILTTLLNAPTTYDLQSSEVENIRRATVLKGGLMKDDLELKFKQADTYAQSVSQSKANEERKKGMIIVEAEKLCVESLRKAGGENIKILSSLEKLDNTFSGQITISASLSIDRKIRKIEIPVSVKEGQINSLDKKILKSAILKGEDALSQSFREINAEVSQRIKEIDAYEKYAAEETEKAMKPTLKKQAASYTQQQYAPTTLTVNKFLLPKSTNIGDTIILDGGTFRVISGEEMKLSKEGSGSFWTLQAISQVESELKK